MYRPVLVTPPVLKPVSIDEVKAHCRIDYDDDNDFLNGLISVATNHLDGWTGVLGRCLVEQSWRQDFDDFWGCLRLPLFPVISVESVKYRDVNNVEQTVSSSDYTLQTDDIGSFVRFTTGYSAPTVYQEVPAVSVTYSAGVANGGTEEAPTVGLIDQAIKHGMLLLISHWYQNREAVSLGSPVEMPMAAELLLSQFRRIRL